jgi:serine/threonine protein kinase
LLHNDEQIIPLRDIFGPPVDRPGEPFEDVYMVLGYMETDLNKIIRSKTVLRDEDIQYLVFQLLRALQFLHSANVLHRDLVCHYISSDHIIIHRQCCTYQVIDYVWVGGG